MSPCRRKLNINGGSNQHQFRKMASLKLYGVFLLAFFAFADCVSFLLMRWPDTLYGHASLCRCHHDCVTTPLLKCFFTTKYIICIFGCTINHCASAIKYSYFFSFFSERQQNLKLISGIQKSLTSYLRQRNSPLWINFIWVKKVNIS